VIRVLVVAPRPALRAGLRAMLERSGFEQVEDQGSLNGAEPLAADVLVLASPAWQEDLAGIGGAGSPGVVLLADLPGAEIVLSRLGLSGWAALPEDADPEQLRLAVESVAQGLALLPAETAASLLGASARAGVAAASGPEEPLTPRELEVLQLLSQGLSNKMIARRLGISEHTVKFHVSSTYAKLGASNRTEAVSHAARRGVISL